MYVRGYLQGSENGRVGTIVLKVEYSRKRKFFFFFENSRKCNKPAKNIGRCLWYANQQITSHILTPVVWSEKLIICDQRHLTLISWQIRCRQIDKTNTRIE
jgi:hypothetical protein